MADNIDVDRVIEEMEAVPQTRERRMILALAYEVRALKSGKKPGRPRKENSFGSQE